ncbi:MAG: hypothetical protein IJ572_02450 [Bacilli bacterium]|nr:hypothetical protein [Bacilli bacterium]
MGEAINLVENFKVEKVIFNCGPYNDLEKKLIKVLDKKKIKYYSCIKELNIDNNKLHFLQTKEYANENDNSNVIYTELNGYKFMFMGNASVTIEKGYERLEELKKIEESFHQDFIQMNSLEEQKKSADTGIRSVLEKSPTDTNIVGGVLSSDTSKSHLIAEKKSDEQMSLEKKQMLEQLKEKVRNGEITLAQASGIIS